MNYYSFENFQTWRDMAVKRRACARQSTAVCRFLGKVSNKTVIHNPCHAKRAEKIKRPKKEIKEGKTRALGSLERKAQ